MSSSPKIQSMRKSVKGAHGSWAKLMALYALRNAQNNRGACERIRRELSKAANEKTPPPFGSGANDPRGIDHRRDS